MNNKVCVGCLELIEPDNLVSCKKSMYWHKSCFDNLNNSNKHNQSPVYPNKKTIPIKLNQWYSWDPNDSSAPSYPVSDFDIFSNQNDKSKFFRPSYVFKKLKEIMKEETHDINNLSQLDETWAKVAKHIVETDKELTEADDPEKLW